MSCISQPQSLLVKNLFVFLTLLAPWSDVVAQEKPNLLYSTSRQFEPAFFRQNVCSYQERLHNKTVVLEDALQGLELRVHIIQSEYFRLNPETGAIDETYPGLQAVLLDKLAERAGFTWRNSFAVTGEVPEGNYTFTQLLQWSAENWDVSIDWWAFSLERVAMGITFPEGWYDGSIIMVGATEQSNDKDEFNFWGWLRPFDNGVWWLIVLTLIFSGFVYWILENIDRNSDKQRLEQNLLENVWLSAIAFTAQFEFRPRTNAARLFTLSLSFWSMVIAAAYTANLASFLVVRNVNQFQIESLANAVLLGVPICTQRSAQSDEAVLKAFPTANLIRKTTEKEVLQAAAAGECTVGITTISTWDNWQRDATVNGGCNLHWIGRPFKTVPAGFATISDSGTYCTSLITDVLNLHMLKLKEELFVEEAWQQYLERRASIDCTAIGTTDADDLENSQLNIQNMGGIFFFHFLLSLVAIIIATIYHITGWDKIPRFAKEGPLSRQAVRQSLAKPLSAARGNSPSESIPSPNKALLRAATKKTFAEFIGRRAAFHREEGSRNLFANSSMYSQSTGDLFKRTFSNRSNILPSQEEITLPEASPTCPQDGYNSGNSLSRSKNVEDQEILSSSPVRTPLGGDASETEEHEALLHDLFMYDLHGPALAIQNASLNTYKNKKGRVSFHADNLEENEKSALLQLAQLQDEQMIAMHVMSQHISQMMQMMENQKIKGNDGSTKAEQN